MSEWHPLTSEQAAILERGLRELSCDEHGVMEHVSTRYVDLHNDRGGLTCDLFEVIPQWYGDVGSPEADKPNFAFHGLDDGPAPFGVRWYKAAGRSPEVDRELAEGELLFALIACSAYLRDELGLTPAGIDESELLGHAGKVTFEDVWDGYANVVVGDDGDGGCEGYGYVSLEDVVVHIDLSDDTVYSEMRWFAYVSPTGSPGERCGRVNGGYGTVLEAACAVVKNIEEHGYPY